MANHADMKWKPIAKGQVICMFKYAHDAELYGAFAEKFTEEQHHPNLVKRFGTAMGLKDEDFEKARPIFGISCT